MNAQPMGKGKPAVWRRPWIRALALLLVVTLLTGLYLGSLSSVDIQRTGAGDLNDTVTGYLLDNTAYVNDTTWNRVKAAVLSGIVRPQTYEEYELLASTHLAHGEYGEALPYMAKCIELSQGTAEERAQLWLKRACLETLTGDDDAAMRSLDTLSTLGSPPAEAYLLRAQLLSVAGKNDEAEEPLARYVSLRPDDLQMRASLAELAYANGRYAAADESYTVLLQNPDSPYLPADAYLKRASCRLALERYAEGLADCEAYVAAGNAADGTLLALRGSLAVGAGDMAAAATDLAAAGDAGRTDCYEQAALCAYQAEAYALCARCAQRAVEESATSDPATLYQVAGLARLAQKEYAEAREQFGLALEADPERRECLYYRGVANMAAGRLNTAIEDFTAAIAAGAQTQSSYYDRAVCRLDQNDLEKAVSDLLQAQKGDDENIARMASELLDSVKESLTAPAAGPLP